MLFRSSESSGRAVSPCSDGALHVLSPSWIVFSFSS